MAATYKQPAKAILLLLRQTGRPLTDIANEYAATVSAVGAVLVRNEFVDLGATDTDLHPWEIRPEHKTLAIMQHFRVLNR